MTCCQIIGVPTTLETRAVSSSWDSECDLIRPASLLFTGCDRYLSIDNKQYSHERSGVVTDHVYAEFDRRVESE